MEQDGGGLPREVQEQGREERGMMTEETQKNKPRVVVVMGSTGVGKTQLAIDLALGMRTSGLADAEVVNADSMQIYRGFPIATAKGAFVFLL